MTSIQRAVAAIAAILAREGVDYSQSKAVFKAARARAGLRAPDCARRPSDAMAWIASRSKKSFAFSIMPTPKTDARV